MIQSTKNRFGKVLYTLLPGDYFATGEDCILGTVTGACACVCLYDAARRIGGMGHFIVPGMIGTGGIFADDIARQGIMSMEYLIGEIVKLGGDRKHLKAKLFGVGSLNSRMPNMDAVIQSNIRFLKEYFALERIPVETEDLGGSHRRQVLFYTMTGAAMRRFQRRNDDASEFARLEQEYIDAMFRNKPRFGKVYLFE
ncbi:MAG TPA: chemoreceptor glutamine deamidase CheD [Spirochaetota bacterium]|nr:chemoreceptor glutamine deamidase CheD [Spirochaetota bacterium]